jgi:hypothetical protein
VGFEECTPDVHHKIDELLKKYDTTFFRLYFTIHPKNWFGPRSIPGKCSNSNYSARSIFSIVDYDIDMTTYTCGDADTIFPKQYFESLEYRFLKSKDRHCTFWQAPISYNYKLHERPFFVRCTSLFRSAFMAGCLIPFNINPMSVYSLSARLLINANFHHPFYQMDDLTTFISSISYAKKSICIESLHLPILNGPTSGSTFKEEVYEWFTQAKRWTIGASETMHYISIKCRTLPFFSRIKIMFIFSLYYGYILCAMTLSGIATVIGNIYHKDDLTTIGVCSLGICYILFGIIVFWMDAKFIKLLLYHEVGSKDDYKISVFLKIVNLVTMYPVICIYSLIEIYAIFNVSIYGKKVCGHIPSKKNGLTQISRSK